MVHVVRLVVVQEGRVQTLFSCRKLLAHGRMSHDAVALDKCFLSKLVDDNGHNEAVHTTLECLGLIVFYGSVQLCICGSKERGSDARRAGGNESAKKGPNAKSAQP